ncbi:MAG: HAMP domain-containing histidine kinase, partial [Chloroflexi bacterium]
MRHALGTLRWRLTLTFVGLLALLLAGLGAYQYLALQRILKDVQVSSLGGDVNAGIALVRGEIANQRGPATPGGPAQNRPAEVARALRVRSVLCANVPNHTDAAIPTGTTLRVIAEAVTTLRADALACAIAHSSGQSVAVLVFGPALAPIGSAGQPEAQIPRLDSGTLDSAMQGRSGGPDVIDSQAGPQLVAAFPIANRVDSVTGVIQLSTSTSTIDDVLSGERNNLAIGGAIVLLVALLVGLLLTGRALAPLRRLTATSRALAGGDLRARSRLEPRRDEVGTLAHSFDDMADRIEAAFTAQAESEARMRRFIADASHELRTPITALKGYIDVLRRGVARDPESLDAALDAMARESERMRVLILDLLTLARIDAQRPLETETFDLTEVIRGVLDEGVPGMPDQLDRDFDSEPVLISADRGAVVTVARNLLVNACKYA